MAVQHDQAIVLRLTDYSESSQILTALGRERGQLRLIAKGARRSTRTRFVPGLDLLERIELSFVPPRGESDLGTLTEWVQRDGFQGLRRSRQRLYATLCASQAVVACTEPFDPHPAVFDELRHLLEALASTAEASDGLAALTHFVAALLHEIGYAPNLRGCVRCDRVRASGQAAYFSASAGGLICRRCADAPADLRRISAPMLDRPEAFPREWFELLVMQIQRIAGRPIPLADWVLRGLGAAPAATSV